MAQAIRAGAFGNQLRGGVKALRAALAMQTGQPFEISFRGFAAHLIGECRDRGSRGSKGGV